MEPDLRSFHFLVVYLASFHLTSLDNDGPSVSSTWQEAAFRLRKVAFHIRSGGGSSPTRGIN